MSKNVFDYLITGVGILILGTGLLLTKTLSNSQGIMVYMPYVFIGIGCIGFGYGMGNMVSKRVLKNNPEIENQIEIDKHDERNVAISNHAKAKSFDFMVYVFGALILSFAIMGIDWILLLLLVFAYLLTIGNYIYYMYKYNREI